MALTVIWDYVRTDWEHTVSRLNQMELPIRELFLTYKTIPCGSMEGLRLVSASSKCLVSNNFLTRDYEAKDTEKPKMI